MNVVEPTMQTTSLEYILIQSRITILDLLERRGYDSTPYSKVIGPEMNKFIGNDFSKFVLNPEHLRMILKSKEDEKKQVIVEYEFTDIRTSVGKGDYVMKLLNDPPEASKTKGPVRTLHNIDPETTEIIVLYEPRTSSDDKEVSPYDRGALDAWMKHKLKIQFWPIKRLVSNPLTHVLQPKFEIVPREEHESLKKELMVRNVTDFPWIKFHNDPAARALGLLPHDIVKITRPSATAGEYKMYRVCVP